jgi:copper chaperone CopZ
MRYRALAIVALLAAVPACSQSAPTPASTGATAPGTVRAAYAITGMHCGGCADAIVAEVGEVKGVKGVQCTFESKCAVIEFTDPSAKADAEHAITKLGYKIAPCGLPVTLEPVDVTSVAVTPVTVTPAGAPTAPAQPAATPESK